MGKFTDFDLDLNFEKIKNTNFSKVNGEHYDTQIQSITVTFSVAVCTKWEYCSVSCDCSPSASDMTACAAHAKEKQNTMMRC